MAFSDDDCLSSSTRRVLCALLIPAFKSTCRASHVVSKRLICSDKDDVSCLRKSAGVLYAAIRESADFGGGGFTTESRCAVARVVHLLMTICGVISIICHRCALHDEVTRRCTYRIMYNSRELTWPLILLSSFSFFAISSFFHTSRQLCRRASHVRIRPFSLTLRLSSSNSRSPAM
jgi:hypothetical protein